MRQIEALQVVGEFAADQWGMITAAQAVRADIDGILLARLVNAGLLHNISRGVYVLHTAFGTTPHMDEKAAWLRLAPTRPAWERAPLDEDGGVISHRSAARVHELGDLLSEQVEITVPQRRTTRDPHVKLRRGTLRPEDVTTVDGLPVTTIERTIDDLLSDHADGGHVGEALAQAVREDRVDLDALVLRIARHSTKYGFGRRDGHSLVEGLLRQVGYSSHDNLRKRHLRDAARALANLDAHQLDAVIALAAEIRSEERP